MTARDVRGPSTMAWTSCSFIRAFALLPRVNFWTSADSDSLALPSESSTLNRL